MIRSLLYLLLPLFAAPVSAQFFKGAGKYQTPLHVPAKNKDASRGTFSFYIDYSYYDDQMYNGGSDPGNPPSPGFRSFIWDVNYNYAPADSSIKLVITTFDSIIDTDNDISYKRSEISKLRIDSVFAIVGHENNSGENDTIITKVIALDSVNYPLLDVVYFADTLITDTALSANDEWLYSFLLSSDVNLELPAGVTAFGVMLEYRGNTADTFGVLIGFPDKGLKCASMSYWPLQSTFYPNTFTHYTQYYAAYGIIPTRDTLDFYYDCNGVPGYQETEDANSFTQDAFIWSKVTITDFASVGKENAMKDVTIVPNPSAGTFNIRYKGDRSDISAVSIKDVSGRTIYESSSFDWNGNDIHISLDAPSGLYFYTVSGRTGYGSGKVIIN